MVDRDMTKLTEKELPGKCTLKKEVKKGKKMLKLSMKNSQQNSLNLIFSLKIITFNKYRSGSLAPN